MRRNESSRLTLLVVCAATAMLMLDIAVVNTALPRMAADLHAHLSGVQWVIDAYTVALAATVLTTGSLADRFGRRRVFTIGLAVFTAASVACGASASIEALVAARAVQGLGAAGMFASSLALIGTAFPDARARGGAYAAYGATIGAAFAVGPLLGGILTSWIGWRSIFWLNAPIGLATMALTLTRVVESREAHNRRVDVAGQLTSAAGLLLLVLALLRAPSDGWSSTAEILRFTGAGLAVVAFLAIERARVQPMLPLALFRRPVFAGAQLAAFAISASFFALFLYITLYLQDVCGLSAIQAGAAYLPSSLLMFLVSAAAAPLMARIAPGRLVTGGLTLVTVGMGLLLITGDHASWATILPATLTAALGTGLLNPALSALVLTSTEPHDQGLAAGTNDVARQGGIAVGIAAMGALIPARALSGTVNASAYVTGLHHAAITALAIAAAGTIGCAALLLGRHAATGYAQQQAVNLAEVSPEIPVQA